MSTLTDQIHQRGYWEVVIRPETFDTERVPYGELAPLLERAAVHTRGWSLPFVDTSVIVRENDSVSQETDWEHHLETWRFFTSGQFTLLAGMPQDWRDRSGFWPADSNWQTGTLLPIFDAIFRFTEIFELAARLAATPAGDHHMHVRVKLANLQGRELYVDANNRASMFMRYDTAITDFERSLDVARDELVAEPRELALQQLVALFERFGWPGGTLAQLRELQSELDRLR